MEEFVAPMISEKLIFQLRNNNQEREENQMIQLILKTSKYFGTNSYQTTKLEIWAAEAVLL